LSGEAYQQRFPGGYVDLPAETTPIDSQMLNAVESALMRLLGVDPADKGVETWDAALGRFKTALVKNENVDPAAAISRNKLDFGAGLADADIAPGANISSSKITGLTGTAPPVGAMMMYGGSVAPSGWLLCDGSVVSRTTQAGIFSVIGTAYGTGDGSTTFNLPDFRGRVPVAVGTHADVGALGANDGVAVESRRPKHKHTVALGSLATGNDTPDHTHTYNSPTPTGTSAGGAGSAGTVPQTSGASTRHTHPLVGVPTVGPQTGSEPTDGAAYLTVNVIIKT
jgi:microcystin-dependent protein